MVFIGKMGKYASMSCNVLVDGLSGKLSPEISPPCFDDVGGGTRLVHKSAQKGTNGSVALYLAAATAGAQHYVNSVNW